MLLIGRVAIFIWRIINIELTVPLKYLVRVRQHFERFTKEHCCYWTFNDRSRDIASTGHVILLQGVTWYCFKGSRDIASTGHVILLKGSCDIVLTGHVIFFKWSCDIASTCHMIWFKGSSDIASRGQVILLFLNPIFLHSETFDVSK